MSEELVLISDREVLTRTLSEISDLLSNLDYLHLSTRSSLKAHARVLWLLQTLCRSHLSQAQATSILLRSEDLRRRLVEGPDLNENSALLSIR